MQLKLLIEINSARGKFPHAILFFNDKKQVIKKTSIIELNVNDDDVIMLCMAGKSNTDTVIDDCGNIIEDMSVILTGLFLGGVDYIDQLYFLPCFDENNKLKESNPYLSRNGCLKIDIHHLVHDVNIDFSNIKILSIQEIAKEVLGRPININIINE